MGQRAKAGACLATLVYMAIPLCQQAERRCPRTGPGKPPDFSRLEDSGPDYGRYPETKTDEICPVSVPGRTAPRLASLVGHEALAGPQHLLRALSASAPVVARCHQAAG